MDPDRRFARIREIHSSGHSGVLDITGGGVSGVGWLLSQPGGSHTLLEAVVPYCERALSDRIGRVPEQACSQTTALALAMTAYQRAITLAPERNQLRLFGLGCTASLVSELPKKGEHRIHVAFQTRQVTTALSLRLNKGARSRASEEEVAADLILMALSELLEKREPLPDLLPGEVIQRESVQGDPLWQEVMQRERGVVWRDQRGDWSGEPSSNMGGLLCGSFNPVHVGHRELRKAAAQFLKTEIGYEMSITNVDKPPLDFLTIAHRLAALDEAPIALTNGPLFRQKSQLFPGMWFVVGMDTAVRVLDPLYAGGSEEQLREDLTEIQRKGCRFLVAGRKLLTGYQTCRDLKIPAGFKDLFVELPTSDFREDISSSELRRSQ